jgi:hypothetical protein
MSKTSQTGMPGRMTVAAKALAALESLDAQSSLLDRASSLLTRILGEDARHAIQKSSPGSDEIVFTLDDIQFHFFYGATPDDDFFQVNYLGAPNGLIPVRTAAGLGYSLAVNLTAIRSMFAHANTPKSTASVKYW